MEFRGHTVALPDGTSTRPAKNLLEKSQQVVSLLNTLKALFPKTPRERIRVADLGCFEGGYSLALAHAGYIVAGFEGREENLKRCHYLKQAWDLDNLTFHQLDLARSFPKEEYDVILAFGLLYHLEHPLELLRRIHAQTRKVFLLNTHYAREDIPSRFRHKLSGIVEHHGYRGRWYQESASRDDKNFPRSSLENDRSFWFLRSELLRVLRDVGFTTVLEQFDCHYSMEKAETAIRRNSRSQFLVLQ